MIFRIFILGALLSSLDLGAFSSGPPPSELRVYFSANREGEVEPCGCQVNQLGGLHRTEQYLSTVPKKSERASLYVSGGDVFFALNPPNKTRTEEDLLRARLIARAYKRWGLEGMVPGWRDFSQGIKTLRALVDRTDATLVSANLQQKGKLLFAPSQVVDLRGLKVRLVGISSAEEMPESYQVTAPDKALVAEVEKGGHDLVVVLSRLGLEGDIALAKKVKGIHLIVGSRSLDILAKPEKVGETWIVQSQNQGQQLGVVDFELKKGGKRSHSLVELSRAFEKANPVRGWMEEYREQVRKIAIEKSGHAQPTTSATPYRAHPMDCRLCHQKQHDFWEGTKHASAYLVLYAKNQHFDPDCIGCHSLGYLESGGYQDIVTPIKLTQEQKKGGTPFVEIIMKEVFAGDPGSGRLDSRLQPERYAVLQKRYTKAVHKLEEENLVKKIHIGVQCEHCHGNRHGHPGGGATVKKVSETSCLKCHAPPHARPYDKAMFAKVACPLSSKH